MDLWATAAGATDLVSAPAFAYVAWRLSQRPAVGGARLAALQFAIWWGAIGLGSAVTGVEVLAGAFGALGFPAAETGYLLTLLIDSVALWGLVSYLTYIYSGRSWVAALSALYVAFYVATLYYTLSSAPYAVIETAGVPALQFHHAARDLLFGFVAATLIIPEVAGAILYATLLFRTKDRTLRYRIAMVSLGLLVFFGLGSVSPSSALVAPSAWTFARAVLDLIAAGLTLMAYFPPELLQRRFGVVPVAARDPAPADARSAA